MKSEGLSRRDLFKAGLAILAGMVVTRIDSVSAKLPTVATTIPPVVTPAAPVIKAINPAPHLIDVVRTLYPKMIAKQICDVQPLTKQTGLIFTIKPEKKVWWKRLYESIMPAPKIKESYIPKLDFDVESFLVESKVHRWKKPRLGNTDTHYNI